MVIMDLSPLYLYSEHSRQEMNGWTKYMQWINEKNINGSLDTICRIGVLWPNLLFGSYHGTTWLYLPKLVGHW